MSAVHDLNLVRSLHELLDTRSVTAAARRVGVTQSAMSRTLARLRDVFGDPLLVRTRRGMEPTPRALELAAPARAALASADAVFAERAAFAPRDLVRTFTIAATDIAMLVVLPALVARLRGEAPGVTVAAATLPAGGPLDSLERGADLAIGFVARAPAALRAQLLFEDHLVCVARSDHPMLARTRTLTLAKYLACEHVAITPTPEPADAIDRALAKDRRRRTVRVRAAHFLLAPALLRDSDLVLTTGARVAAELARLAPLATADCPVDLGPLRIGQLWHERSDRDRAHAWFRALIREVSMK